jgi:hypothetical protein
MVRIALHSFIPVDSRMNAGPFLRLTLPDLQRLKPGIVPTCAHYVPQCGCMTSLTVNTAALDYQALQVKLDRRLSRGLEVLGSCSWSHSIDSASTDAFAQNVKPIICLLRNRAELPVQRSAAGPWIASCWRDRYHPSTSSFLYSSFFQASNSSCART